MNTMTFYALIGVGLLCIALHGLIAHQHLLRKILSINLLSSSVFLILIALAQRTPGTPPDPVCHAMVITGVVVAVSATALALSLMLKLKTAAGITHLPRTLEH